MTTFVTFPAPTPWSFPPTSAAICSKVLGSMPRQLHRIFLQCPAGYFNVIKRDGVIAEFLVFFVAFPCDQNNIPGLSHRDRPRNRLSPIDDLFVVLMLESGFDIANDRFRIFLSRVV